MKHTVCQLIVFVSAVLLCALPPSVLAQKAASSAAKGAAATAVKEAASATKQQTSPTAVPAKEQAAPAKETASKETASKETAAKKDAEAQAKEDAALIAAEQSGAYQYFEYQVIAVPKKTVAAAAKSLNLPENSIPTDELLPAIYREGGYRVIGYSAGYSAANTPLAFKMSRSEFFPDFYIMPNDGSGDPDSSDEDDSGSDGDDGDNGDNDDSAESGQDDGDDSGDDSGDDNSDGDADEDYDPADDYSNSYNNLATIFPFFGGATVFGNEFFLDVRPPRLFSMESNMKKLNGFSNTDYGDLGRGQSPIFDDNSFASTLSATRGKPMLVARAMSSSTTWVLHVFFSRALPAPRNTTPATGSENKLVKLDFQIVRAKWNDVCAAGNPDGSPAVPSDAYVRKLMASTQLRDFYSPTFRLIPSQDPVSIQLNARTQFAPLKWIPGKDPGSPAIPLNNEPIWTGTAMRAAARILDDGKIIQLEYSFEKSTQTGWRNYQYSFYGDPDDGMNDNGPANRYARPQTQKNNGPEILSSTLKLPMIDTTAFRQTLFLEVGKPVLAARISNPAYQPDTLTLLFVTATIDDAP